MSTCPEKDIHSVYLDNELPPVYIKEYEAHVSQCAQCKNELERIKALRDNLRADSAAIALSSADLEKSFERFFQFVTFGIILMRGCTTWIVASRTIYKYITFS